MRKILTLAFCAAICFGLLASPALGQGKGKGHSKDEQGDDRDKGRGGVQVTFSVRDRDTIREYYHDRYSNLPPGLAKRNGKLPPGLQKHLERDGRLPPGLQKRVEPFPDELERRLPRLPDGYGRVVLGVDVLILNRKTQRIMDVIHDILRP